VIRISIRRLVLAGAAVVLAGTAIAVTTVANAQTAAPAATRTYYVTLYGWPDNSPPGNVIAFPVIHKRAGGRGTYADPVTFAANHGLGRGTRVYIPYMKKYFIMEDECASCNSRHIDLWAGGSTATANAVLACEDNLTRNASVVVNPAKNLPVNTTPIFNTSTKRCYKP
jgi:hypothetical protein